MQVLELAEMVVVVFLAALLVHLLLEQVAVLVVGALEVQAREQQLLEGEPLLMLVLLILAVAEVVRIVLLLAQTAVQE
jgi:hypothetical protein